MRLCVFGSGAKRRAAVAAALLAGTAFTSSAFAQAGTDDCASAPLLTLNTLASGDNTLATDTNDGVSCTSAQGTGVSIKKSVWYRFNPGVAGVYRISTCGSLSSGTTPHDTVLAVFTAGTVCANALTTANILACNDQSDGTNGVACNPAAGDNSHLQVNLPTAGVDYLIRLSTWGNASAASGPGPYQIVVTMPTPPSNDTCATATNLTLTDGVPVQFSSDNGLGTTDAIDVGTCNAVTSATSGVWWRYDATAAGAVSVDEISGQGIATGVWEMDTATADCPVAGPATICNAAESFTFPVQPAKTYYILIHTDSSTVSTTPLAGTFTFATTPANDTCAGATILSLPADTAVPFSSANFAATNDALDIGTCNIVSTATGGVWYRYDATANGSVVLNETSSQGIATGVFEIDTGSAACPGAGPATICNAAEAFAFPVVAGKTYVILIQNDAAAAPTVGIAGTFTFVPAPANDACANAAVLSLPPTTAVPFSVNNIGAATDALDIGTCNGVSTATSGVWFRFDAPGPGLFTLNETSNQNIATGVFEMETSSAACPVAGPATVCNSSESFSFSVRTGKTYYILVQNDASALTLIPLAGTFTFTPAPANDECAGATALSLPPGAPVAFSVNNTSATTDPIDPGSCNSVSTATSGVWFRYDATATGAVLLDETSSQGIATGVWEMDTATAACPGAGPATFCSSAEAFSFPVQPGRTYYILVHTDSSTLPTVGIAGAFTFAPTPANDACAGATVLSLPGATPVPFAVNNFGATTDAIDIGTCNVGSTATNGVWFRFDAPGPGVVQFAETSAQNVATGVFEMDTATAACPGAGPATVCSSAEAFNFNVLASKTYYILVQTDSSTPPSVALAGTFTFFAPTNEDCASAAVLSGPGTFLMSNLGSANAPSANSPVACPTTTQTMSNDVWYAWTATANGTIALMTRSVPNAFSGRLAIYEGGGAPGLCPATGAAPLACNAFSSAGVSTPVPTATVTAGNVYYFQFASQTAGSTGVATVDFDFAPNATGRCCVGAACSVRTPGECSAAGGTYAGDGTLCSDPTANVSSYTGTGGAVPDGDPSVNLEGVLTSTINVPDSFSIANVEVDMVWSTGHIFAQDLIITLSNGSTTFFLTNRPRRGVSTFGSADANYASNSTYTFSDAGATTVDAALAPTGLTNVPVGVYRPGGVNALTRGFQAAFNGAPATGAWTLRIRDHANLDTGTLGSWTLRLTQGSTPACAPATTLCCRGSTCETVAVGSCTVVGGSQAGASTPAGTTCNAAGVNHTPCCKADYNKQNNVELLDIFAFLNDWFAGRPYADFNGQNNVDLLDIFAFLGAWFAGPC